MNIFKFIIIFLLLSFIPYLFLQSEFVRSLIYNNTSNNNSVNSASMDKTKNNTDYTIKVFDIIGTGLVTFSALFFAHLALEKWRKPKIIINADKKLIVKEIKLKLLSLNDPFLPTLVKSNYKYLPIELIDFEIKYNVNRIVVRNSGRIAAEDCKGILKIDEEEEKVCWFIPGERYKMTINSSSIEYLDVCASVNKQALHDFSRSITDKINDYSDNHRSIGNPEDLDSITNQPFVDILKSLKDYTMNVPLVISPTEEGWNPSPFLNRIIKLPSDAKILITSKNTSPYEIKIKIKEPDNNGTVLHFN